MSKIETYPSFVNNLIFSIIAFVYHVSFKNGIKIISVVRI